MATNGTGRAKPNILITGTPGTGKSVTASEVTTKCGLNHIDIGQVAKNGNYYEGWDDKYQCHILDEEKVHTRTLL
jgi:adenylate kinase